MMTLGVIHTPDLRTALRRLIEFIKTGTGFEAAELIDDDHTPHDCPSIRAAA
jgi:hypothetical protein